VKIISRNGKKFLKMNRLEWERMGMQYKWGSNLPDPEKVKNAIQILEQLSGNLDELSKESVWKFIEERQQAASIKQSLMDVLGHLNKTQKPISPTPPVNASQSEKAILTKLAEVDLKKLDEKQVVDVFKQFSDHGRANEKGITEKDVDPEELKMGIKVEMEHTTDKNTSTRIALDHLAELKDYYTRLNKMEEEGKSEGSEI